MQRAGYSPSKHRKKAENYWLWQKVQVSPKKYKGIFWISFQEYIYADSLSKSTFLKFSIMINKTIAKKKADNMDTKVMSVLRG